MNSQPIFRHPVATACRLLLFAFLSLSAALLVTTPIIGRAAPAPARCADILDAAGPDTAPPIIVGEPQNRVICPAGEIEWAVFFAVSGKTYTIVTAPGSVGELDTELWVLDRQPDGTLQQIAYNDDSPQGPRGFSRIEFLAPHDGWYWIKLAVKGGIGYDGLVVSLRVDLLPVELEATPAPIGPWPPPPLATSTPGQPPPVPATAPAVSNAVPAISGQTIYAAAAVGVTSPTPDPLLYPLPGNQNSDNLPIFVAGDPEARQPDRFDDGPGNDTLETAAPIAPNAFYEYLNFIPHPGLPWDSDFYLFQAKGRTCYQVFTTHLSVGLDTTLVLWAATVTHTNGLLQIYAAPTRTPLAQNDDAIPGSGDTHSLVQWCSARDQAAVIEAHTHYWQPLVSTVGKTYALGIAVAPPTPTPSPGPTRTPRPAPPANSGPGANLAPPPVYSQPGSGAPLGAPATPPPATPRPAPPTVSISSGQGATALPPPPSATPAPTNTPMPTSPPSATPTATASVTPTATPAPPQVSVDVVIFFAASGQAATRTGPDPNSAIPGLRLQLIDLRTNEAFADAITDANGHAHFAWGWTGPVQVAILQFQQAYLIEANDLGITANRGAAGPNAGRLYLPIQVQPYIPPAVHP